MRRNAVLFVLISLFSGFGSYALGLAAGLWILDLTGSAGLAALAGIGVYTPTLAAPWLGALVDRFPRRPLLIAVDVLIGTVILTLLATSSAPWIYLVLLVRGFSYVLLDAGETALLPAALPADLLGDVNGWRSSAQEGMKLLAPLAGAALYAWRGPHAVVLLCAALPLVTAALYALVQLRPSTTRPSPPQRAGQPAPVSAGEGRGGPPAEAGARRGRGEGERSTPVEPWRAETQGDRSVPADVRWESGLGDRSGPADVRWESGQGDRPVPADARLGESGQDSGRSVEGEGRAVTFGWGSVRVGLGRLWREPVRTPVLVAAVAIAVSGLTNAAVLLHLVGDLHRPATHLGILSSVQGAGSILGGLLVGRLLAHLAPARVAALGAVLFAAACVTWSLPWWPAMLAGSALTGLGLPWTLIAGITAIQTGTPDHLLGRVAATGNMVMFGPITLAIPLGAALSQVGAHPPLILGAAVILTAALLAVRRTRLSATT
ncbi:hypothetical protein GCM10010168_86620 [Actinoplanes ianthinogenes]|uniref:MFS transporter n=1 Tax=Actinoplanes ianthinogenes TaxID=122358 RepID=A0ABN6CK78_9ACTN|nr:MFS transporter [Actinoplanes ianthinogenes]BCJ45393.1 hypothetical protein Aiant_60500 [Actinoplanes ianthinogenes]GGR54175.1 hypothetical protein GCM10010168_86620 [Actinoplanes ianthinogenes]